MRVISFIWALMRRLPAAPLSAVMIGGMIAVVLSRVGWQHAIVALVLVAALCTALHAWRRYLRRGTHGTAAFASEGEIGRHGLRSPRGLILGRKGLSFLRFDKSGHLLTFAPTRSGKGTGCIIPNLLDHPGSAFVVDPKGENFAASGAFRRTLGPVHLLSPFGADADAARFNPLDFVRVGQAEEIDDAALIADMLVVPEGNETFWDSEARALIAMLVLHVVNDRIGTERTLHHVWSLLMLDNFGFDNLLDELKASSHQGIAIAARGFSQKEERERSAVISTAQTHMKIWRSPLLADATCTSGFRMEDMKRGTVSIYLVIPPELLDTYRPFVRLIVGLAIVAMTRKHARHARRTVFFLDEVAALGHMGPIESGIGWVAGYGVTLWLFFQDLDQLMKIYPRWRSVIANAAVRQAFNVTDYATARELSDMMGVRTVPVRHSGHAAHGPLTFLPNSFSTSEGDTARRLMTPDEIMTMPADRQLIFVQSCHPILAWKIRWFTERRLRHRNAKANRQYSVAD